MMPAIPSPPLDHPFDAPPSFASAKTVVPGVLWIRLALPFQLDHINVWALDGGANGWTLVDSGLGDSRTRDSWETLFAGALHGRPIARVIATHFHPDHIGAAGWLVERTGAEFATSLTEWLFACALSANTSAAMDQAVERFYRRSGLDDETLTAVLSRKNAYTRGVPSVPPTLSRLRAGDVLPIGETKWRVVGGGGHTVEPVSLYDAERRVLIVGDQILPRISPNISVWPTEPDADPLTDYLGSLAAWSAFPPDTLVLPSHGLPFRGLHRRATELRDHHTDRLDEIIAQCATPQTAAMVTRTLFNRPLDPHQMVFAMGEAIAHLNHLLRRGILTRRPGPNAVDLYQRA
ncbi:MBL fold metallo-hydrolase [Azospirillum griseum]|nr:MBL fold metallo-hydrolase [Azospirillum griseum]